MGIGPIPAVRKLLERTGVAVADIDLVELNEAFASQSVAVVRELGLDPERVNVNGGAIALGHPLGMSGARLVVSLVHELRRRGGRYGLATLCVGVGQGQAALFERTAVSADAHPGRDRRRGPGGADAGPAAASARDRVGRAREPQPRALRAAHPRGRARAGHRRPAARDRRRRAAATARASSTTASSSQFDGERHRIPLSELTGGARDRDLRPDRGGEGPDPAAAATAAIRCSSRRRTWRCTELDGDRPRITYRHDGARARARLRLDRRLRRLPRRVARVDSRPACCG